MRCLRQLSTYPAPAPPSSTVNPKLSALSPVNPESAISLCLTGHKCPLTATKPDTGTSGSAVGNLSLVVLVIKVI